MKKMIFTSLVLLSTSSYALSVGEAQCIKTVFPLIHQSSLPNIEKNMQWAKELCKGATEAEGICISSVIETVYNAGYFAVDTSMSAAKKLCQ
jgi:hypothetical protein